MSVVSVATLITVSLMTMDMGLRTDSDGVAQRTNVSSSEPPDHWLESYDEARRLASQYQVPILLHFDASWCGACRRMEQDVLNHNAVRDMMGNRLIGVRIDADRHKNLIAQFGISTLPTEVVVLPDGTNGGRYVGAASLNAYLSRLKSIGGSHQSVGAKTAMKQQKPQTKDDGKNVRSCLIVRHDGKMVGMGGYSPVALTESRQWKKGSNGYVSSHEGVVYFFQSQNELNRFKADPGRYIPRLHGCDLVELFNENRATAGAIEYGSFYKGRVFFFASLENRNRFENNPGWYLGVATDSETANDQMFPFLNLRTATN